MKDSNFLGSGAPSAPNANKKSRFADIDYPVPVINLYAPPYSAEEATLQRDKLVTKLQTIPDKMLLYNSST